MADKDFDEDLPSMVPERDQLRGRQSATRTTPAVSSPADNSGSGRTSPVVWLFLVVALLLAIGGGVASSWLYQQSGQQALLLESAEKRIAELEGKLSDTGENMNESQAALQVKVNELSKKTKELWEQMDKLWASAWRRNQTDLAELGKRLDKTDKSLAAQRDLVKGLEKTVQSDKTMQQSLNKQISGLQGGIDELKESLLVYQASLSEQENQILEIKGVAVDTDEYRKSIELRLKDLEQWIQSINASRKQVNEQMVDLEVSIQKLQRRVSSLHSASASSAPAADDAADDDAAGGMDIVIGAP